MTVKVIGMQPIGKSLFCDMGSVPRALLNITTLRLVTAAYYLCVFGCCTLVEATGYGMHIPPARNRMFERCLTVTAWCR